MGRESNRQAALSRKELRDLKILARFTATYCKNHHVAKKTISPLSEDVGPEGRVLGKFPLCADCREFLAYAFVRRLKCPLDEKPACKDCHIHCFRSGHREKVREIMRFSGPYLVKRGRIDLLWYLLF